MIDLRRVLAVDGYGLDPQACNSLAWRCDIAVQSGKCCPSRTENETTLRLQYQLPMPGSAGTTGDGKINLHSIGKLVPTRN